LIDRRRQAPIGARQALDGGDGFRAGDFLGCFLAAPARRIPALDASAIPNGEGVSFETCRERTAEPTPFAVVTGLPA
jgi:hypothetical protein